MIDRRVHAEREEPFVVFLIGMRINRWWALHRWVPIVLLAPRLVGELRAADAGLLGSRPWFAWRSAGFVQYWDSPEALRAYAHDAGFGHREGWQAYTDDTASSGAVGIWHETYVVDPDDYETVYNRMPESGLGAAEGTDLVDATGDRGSMFGRLGRSTATGEAD